MARRRTPAALSEFGRTVEAWRKKNGLSQAVVASLIGTHQRTYNDWLKKDCMPAAVYQIARLAALMGESVGDLVQGDASIEPLANPDFVRSLLARTIPPASARRYVEDAKGADSPPESVPEIGSDV